MKILRAMLLVVFGLVMVLAVGLWWLLFTQGGRDVLVAHANGYLGKLETPVVLGRLEGNVLGDVRLASVAVADKSGVWLVVEGIRLVWQPMALWHGTRPFELLDVAKIEVARLPVSDATDEEVREEGGGDVVDYLVYVPRNVMLHEVAVEAPVTGRRHRVVVELASEGEVQEVSVSTLEGPVTAVSGTVAVEGNDAGRIDLGLREAPRGLLGGLMQLPENMGLEARVIGGAKGGDFTLETLAVRAGATRVNAVGEGAMDGSRIAGVVSASVPDLREWQKFVGDFGGAVDVVGEVSGSVAVPSAVVSATLVRPGERAVVVVRGAGVVSPVTGSAEVSGSWVKGKNLFALTGAVEADPVRAVVRGVRLVGPGTVVSGSGVVDLATLLVTGNAVVKVQDLRPLAALAGVEARGGVDAGLAASGKDGVQVGEATVGRFEVDYGDYHARLKRPARLVWDGKTGSLSPMELEIAGGTVTAQGTMNEESVAADVAVRNVDVEQLMDSDVLTGRVSLSAKVSGKSAAPVVVATGEVKGETGGYPLEVTARGDWRNGVLGLVVGGKSSSATAKADVAIGGGLSLLPFAVGVDEGSSLKGSVTADVPLAMFNNLLWASRQQVGGRLSGRGTLAGTLGAPEVGGKFVLADGSYSHSTSGICLKNIGAEIVGSRDKVVVSNLRSDDGAGGRLSGSASVGLQGERPLAAQIDLSNLQLFCGGMATGQIDGQLTARGTLADHMLAGKLLVGPLNVQLPGASNESDIPQVETVRVKPGVSGTTEPLTVTRLAVRVDAPQRIYVRGRGLDAEFGGAIDIGGTADNLLLTGSLKALRGQYTLLDRTLQLADTSVRFEGPMPPSPYLAIKATTEAQGTEITLNVTGTATKPQLSLTSDPSLPQDEVLALLLFGRKLANISAFEALKLAQATRVLAGLDGGGPSILDKARQTLGVDTLDIGSGDESGDVTVTTGKYLTDKIYLSVQQGAEPEDREVRTEIELAPSVTGNTTVNGEGTQSFGIEWRRNY